MSKISISRVETALSITEIERGLKKYISLRDQIHEVNVSKDRQFQKDYAVFFLLTQARKNEEFLAPYFQYMERHKNDDGLTFEAVLKHLYDNVGSVEPSFGSKLLSMINPKMPVWDSKVVENLALKEPPHYRQKNGKKYANIDELIEFYREEICEWYNNHFNSGAAKEWIKLFDARYPETKSRITDVKKIDLTLWQMQD